jgi:hypothetical protein
MKKYMIWPMLVPAIAFCQDDIAQSDPIPNSLQSDLEVAGNLDPQDRLRPSRDSWHTRDFDTFLRQPLPANTIEMEGTVTEVDGDSDDDVYYSEYDINAE